MCRDLILHDQSSEIAHESQVGAKRCVARGRCRFQLARRKRDFEHVLLSTAIKTEYLIAPVDSRPRAPLPKLCFRGVHSLDVLEV